MLWARMRATGNLGRGVGLQQGEELVSIDLAVAENCREQTWPDRLSRVHGHDRSTAVGVTEEVVTALSTGDLEPHLPQGRNDLSSGDSGKTCHDTVIF
jgi:hypothetical protein